MKQNVTLSYNHEKLGPLTIEIIAQNQINNTSTISPAFVKTIIDKPTTEFLFALYQEYMSNDTLIDIIGQYLDCSTKLTNQQIVDEINHKYSAQQKHLFSNHSTKFNDGDGVNLYIKSDLDKTSPLFTANFITKIIGQSLSAYLDFNTTREDVRHQGLHSLGMNIAKKYFASNGFIKIFLEEQNRFGNEFDLAEMYRKDGYSQIDGTNIFEINLNDETPLM